MTQTTKVIDVSSLDTPAGMREMLEVTIEDGKVVDRKTFLRPTDESIDIAKPRLRGRIAKAFDALRGK